ncbi:toxin-antitoxin system HicB family antitoxin [Hydrogenophaga sp.]|uniref:toxin-antitoxin system HicB family antitoxin n=1 Tax=Hydrogenophaga sp. TaxID=1904254 RepID=UPI003AF573EC
MTLSVRMDPLLEKELELAARRQGVTKSQFVVDAVERALGRKNAYQVLLQAKAQVAQEPRAEKWAKAFAAEHDQPYETEASRAALIAKLRAKHGLGTD